MKIIKTRIKGLLIIKSKIYNDKRGFFKEVIKKKILNENFKFDCVSFSKKKTLRGLHIQLKNSQAKLITVSHGKIFDVVVDLRIKSKTFGKSFAINMSDKSDFSLFSPPTINRLVINDRFLSKLSFIFRGLVFNVYVCTLLFFFLSKFLISQ